jgi:phosphatidylglycerophosphate synthase
MDKKRGIFLILMYLLMFIDITFTYFLMFLDIKKDNFDYRNEKGLLARILIKYMGLSPITYLIQMFFATIILFGSLYIALINDIILQISYTLYGIYIMIIFHHINYLLEAKKNWNNKEFWYLYKKINMVRL